MPSGDTRPDLPDPATCHPALPRLYGWADEFRHRLRLRVPRCLLRVAPLGPDILGCFHCVGTRRGAAYAITFDEGKLARRLAEGNWRGILTTLVHEQVHLWQLVHGTSGGHDAEYRTRALACGLVVSERGVTESHVPGGPFLALLAEWGACAPDGIERRRSDG